MGHVCNIDSPHEVYRMIHYLKDMAGDDDSAITVQSPINIQQCKLSQYEYDIANYIKNSECTVSIDCGELHGGGCQYEYEGNYNLQIEVRHAWTNTPTPPWGSGRICRYKKYERRLLHNEMIAIKMTLHVHPQYRDPTEKFTCLINRKCNPLEPGEHGHGHNYTTKSYVHTTTTPSMTYTSSKHPMEYTFPNNYVDTRSTNKDEEGVSLIRIFSTKTQRPLFDHSDGKTEKFIGPSHMTSMPPTNPLDYPEYPNYPEYPDYPTNILPTKTNHPPLPTNLDQSLDNIENENPYGDSGITYTPYPDASSDHPMNNQMSKGYGQFVLSLYKDEVPILSTNITVFDNDVGIHTLDLDNKTVMLIPDDILKQNKSLQPDIGPGSLNGDKDIGRKDNVKTNPLAPILSFLSLLSSNNDDEPISQSVQDAFSIPQKPFVSEQNDKAHSIFNRTKLASSFDRMLSCASVLNSLKAITNELVNLFYFS